MTPLYVYAIVPGREVPTRALGRGIGGGELALVGLRGRGAVVVERASAVLASATSVVAHDRVVRRIARAFSAVLPLRFGTTAADERALRRLLAPLAHAIGPALERVRGAVQFTLRVDGQPAPPRPAARGAGPGTRWLARKTAEQQVPEIGPLAEATRSVVREVRVERHPAPARPFASAYHLVARPDVRAWRAAIARTTPLLAVVVTVTGPWPPYAFAELA